MSTPATLISRAMRLLGQLPSGETPTDDEYSDGLIALNAMLDSWNNERLMCYATRDESLTLSAGTGSYTIGPTGTLVSARPVSIEAAWIVSSNQSYGMTQITDGEYAAIQDKTTQANWPTKFNYRPTMSNGTVYVWPVPNTTGTMNLQTKTPMTSFTATSDTVTLPPGWEEALAYNLAIELAPEFQTSVRPEVGKRASDSKAAIKYANSEPIEAQPDLIMLAGTHGPSNITSDQ